MNFSPLKSTILIKTIPQFFIKETLVIILFFLSTIISSAQTTYTFSHSDNARPYSDASSWSPSYPGTTINAGDTVIINSGVFITVSGFVNNGTFITNADIGFTRDFENNGIVNINSGIADYYNVFVNNNTLIINSHFEDGVQSNQDAIISNTGTIDINGTFIHDEGTFNNTGIINNYNIFNSVQETYLDAAPSLLINNGTINNYGTGNALFVSLTNNGTITNDNELNIEGISPSSNTTTGIIINNDSMDFDRITFTNSGIINNGGLFRFSDVLNNTATGSITNTGTLTNFETLTNAGTITSTSTGILTNKGTLTIQSSGSLINAGSVTNEDILTIESSGSLTNSGSLTSTFTLTIESSGSISNSGILTSSRTFTNSGSLTNAGTFTQTTNGFLDNYGTLTQTTSGTFSNYGTLAIYTDGASYIDENGTLSNYGTITNNELFEANGTFNNTASGSFSNTKNIAIQTTGSIVNDGTITSTAAGNVNNLGSIDNNNTISNSGIIDSSGTLNISSSGTIDNYRSIITKGTTSNLGIINNSVNAFLLVFLNGTLNNGGLIDNLGRIISAGTTSNSSNLSNTGAIFNSGTYYNLEDGTIDNIGTMENSAILFNLGSILNTGTFDNTGSLIGYNISHTGDFSNNDGVLQPAFTFFSSFFSGTYTFNNSYTHNNSTLNIRLGSLTEYGKVAVTNTANLSGVLDVALFNYTPNIGDTFTILTAGNISGTFATVNLPADYNWEVIYTATEVNIKVIPAIVNPKIFLQGALISSGNTSLMRDDLRTSGYLPTTSPYADGITCDASVFNTGGTSGTGLTGDNIVDWIWVELRDVNDNTNVIAGKSGLLQKDGDVVAIDGVNGISFNVPFKDYYIVIKHRNHLGIISNAVVSLTAQTTIVDFTNGASQITFGTNAQKDMETGTMALWSGNVNGDTVIQYTGTTPDSPSILSQALNDLGNFLNLPTFSVTGYSTNDINMDGNTQYTGTNPDTPLILQNILSDLGNFLNLSTHQIIEQLPEN